MENIIPGFPTEKIINPIYDEGFKIIFGRENVSEALLVNLFNSIFAGDSVLGNITSVQFINTEKPNEIKDERGLRYDLRCHTSSGHNFIVEMQKADQTHFIERCVYYISRDIAEQGFKGTDEGGTKWDYSLTPVVGVFFCNFSVEGLENKPVIFARLLDEESHKPIGAFERYVFIQLPWFQKDQEECESMMDKWIYNIKNMGTTQTVAFKTQEDIFQYLNNISNVSALNKDERRIYEAALMRARDYNAQMKTAREKARTEGLAEGRAEGLAEGRAEGLAEGVLQGKAIMIRKMAESGLPLSAICKMADLPEEEVRDLL